MSTISFIDYLKKKPLEQKLMLTVNKNLSFHWSNWDQACHYLRSSKNDHFQYNRMQSFEKLLDEFKSMPVWLRDKEREHKTNVYDLYVSMLDQRIKAVWSDQFKDTLISQMTEAGPYMSLTSMRWFDKDIYSLFVYRKILLEEGPTRDFRLGVEVPTKCYFNGSALNKANLELIQISKNGVLFKLDGPSSIAKLKSSKEVEFSLDLTPFYESFDNKLENTLKKFSKYDFKNPSKSKITKFELYETNILELNNNITNMQFSNGKNTYIFLTYEQLTANNSSELRSLMNAIINKIELQFKDQLSSMIAA